MLWEKVTFLLEKKTACIFRTGTSQFCKWSWPDPTEPTAHFQFDHAEAIVYCK